AACRRVKQAVPIKAALPRCSSIPEFAIWDSCGTFLTFLLHPKHPALRRQPGERMATGTKQFLIVLPIAIVMGLVALYHHFPETIYPLLVRADRSCKNIQQDQAVNS
ncbi:MAG: hypothetical protein QNI88_14060, partial [Desulfobacterales bacterium]|nr:hypothetical protein [Desulfobacterales bacterium]